jgi:uncharacterized delta-60 repeat protein
VQIVGTSGAGQPLVIANQGTWSINPTTGAITFTPVAGFTGNPTPISYTVKDSTGLVSNPATVNVDYQQTAPVVNNDNIVGIVGMPVIIDVLGNDLDAQNNIDPASVQIVGTTGAGQPLIVAGEGTWAVNPNTGAITFAPATGFIGNPTPISYTVKDTSGLVSNQATLTVTIKTPPNNIAPQFGVSSGIATPAIGVDDFGNAVATQSDGLILIAGQSLDANGNNTFALSRYDANGNVDSTFGTAGKITTAIGSEARANAIAVQADGKILLAGVSDGQFAVLRYNADGSLDTSFGINGAVLTAIGSEAIAKSIVVAGDKILVAGTGDSNSDGLSEFALVRYNLVDGSLDTSFNGSGIVNTLINAEAKATSVMVQSDGKILVAGSSDNGSAYEFALARYNSNGSLDNSFSGDGITTTAVSLTASANSIALQNDGKIVLAGTSNNGTRQEFAVARYDSAGNLDASFSGDGVLTTAIGSDANAYSVVMQGDKILVAGDSKNADAYEFALARYDSNGNLDTSFDSDGILSTDINVGGDDTASSLALQQDGKILVAGSSYTGTQHGFSLARYNNDGSLDTLSTVTTSSSGSTAPRIQGGLGGIVSYNKNGSPVVLDVDVTIQDVNLDALPSYNGATLTLAREGGANNADVFSQKTGGSLGDLIQGQALTVNGIAIGTVTNNSNGTLALTFNTNATKALVNQAMQQLAYSNNAVSAAETIKINWLFNDQNPTNSTGGITGTGQDQGLGGALTAAGSVTVNTTLVIGPTAVDDVVYGIAGQPTVVDVLRNDPGLNLNSTTVSITTAGAIDTNGDGYFDKLIVAGEGTWTVDPKSGDITFTPLSGFTANPTPISYSVNDNAGIVSNQATVTIYQSAPTALNDYVHSNGANDAAVTVAVLNNDIDPENNLDPSTVKIVDPAHPTSRLTALSVTNQGTWTVDTATGKITFTPIPGFIGDPTPIVYTVKDTTGVESNTATVAIDYLQHPPTAMDDKATGKPEKPVTLNILGNDSDPEKDLDPTSVRIVGTANAGDALVVNGEGKWTVDAVTGAITFTPIAGFIADPTPIHYTVSDKLGLESAPATVVVDYPQKPIAVNDSQAGFLGQAISVNVLNNDQDPDNNIDPTRVKLINASEADGSKVVAGEGTWKVNPTTGVITFTPIAGFTGNPTPISYTVQDTTGLISNPALVNISYLPLPIVANNDIAIGTNGEPITLNVLANDINNYVAIDPRSVQIFGTEGAGQPLFVLNQGVWSINSTTGAISFTPNVGFIGDPTPIIYTVKDLNGIVSNAATVSVYYASLSYYNATLLGEVAVVNSFANVHHLDKDILRNFKMVDYTYELSPLYEVKFFSYFDPKLNPVSLAGELKDQFVSNGILLYSVADKFKHTDPSIPLKYEASLPSGKALPEFVNFNEKTGQFKFNAELAKAQHVNSIVIRVLAFDKRGNQASASFQTRFSNDGSYKTINEHNPLRLTGMLEHQFVIKGIGRYAIEHAFEHTNPNEKLVFTATLYDGSPLPNFVRFDSDTKNFTFDAEQAQQKQIKKLIIKVTVKDSHGNSISSNFEVNFDKNEVSETSSDLSNDAMLRADLDGFANETHAEATDFMKLIEALFDSATQPSETDRSETHASDAIHNKHSLNEQIKTAGFFGYQQNKGQLVADLSSLFNQS